MIGALKRDGEDKACVLYCCSKNVISILTAA